MKGLCWMLSIILLALPVSAAEPTPVKPQCAAVAPTDLPRALKLGEPAPADGIFLSRDRAAKLACEGAATEAERDALKAAPARADPIGPALLLGAGVGVVAGAVLGYLLRGWVGK